MDIKRGSFNKLFWGTLFIMLDFRLQGFDVLPDVIGYIIYACALGALATNNGYFKKAFNSNFPLIVLSVFSIYEKQNNTSGFNISEGAIGIVLVILSTILGLLVMYNLFQGINEVADERGKTEITTISNTRWKQYLYLQIATFVMFIAIFIPIFALFYIFALFIASIAYAVVLMIFFKRCEEALV